MQKETKLTKILFGKKQKACTALLLVCVMIGCLFTGIKQSQHVQAAEAVGIEGGNSMAAAAQIQTSGQEYISELSQAGEEDWYTFTTPGYDCYAAAYLGNQSVSSYVYLWLYSQYSEELVKNSVYIRNGGTVYRKLKANTKYYVKCSAGSNNTGIYKFSISFFRDDDANNKDQASIISEGYSYERNFPASSDVDWFCFTARSTGEYKLSAKNFNIGNRYNNAYHCYLMTENEEKLADLALDPTYEGTETVALLKGKTYYIKCSVSNYLGNYRFSIAPASQQVYESMEDVLPKCSRGSYLSDLQPVFEEALPVEGKSSQANALEIRTSGETYISELSKAGEEDWYTFTTPEYDCYAAAYLGNQSVSSYVYLWLYSQYSEELVKNSVYIGNGGTVYRKLKANTKYYVKCSAGSNSTGMYKFGISFLKDIDADDRNQAGIISEGYSYERNLVASNDIDWFCFMARSTGEYQLAAKNFNIGNRYNNAYHCYLMTENEEVLADLALDPTYEGTKTVSLTKGKTYYIKCSVSNYSGSYRFSIAPASQQVVPEPEETKKPDITTQPPVTEAPVRTTAPSKTETPVRTTAPSRTETPVRTTAPSKTETPVRTTAPSKTETPVRTTEPSITDTPWEYPEDTWPPEETDTPWWYPGDTPRPVRTDSPWEEVQYVVGDLTGDGYVKLDDAQLALKIALRIVTDPTYVQIKAGDVVGNGDGVKLQDAQAILKRALRIPVVFNQEGPGQI